MPKNFRVEFEMQFDDKFDDNDIEDWLRYALGQYGGCADNELSRDYDLEATSLSVAKV